MISKTQFNKTGTSKILSRISASSSKSAKSHGNAQGGFQECS